MKEEAITQVVDATVCPRFEDLEPLTEEEADALSDVQAGERMQAIGLHCKMLFEKARTIVLRFLPEIRSMRKRYSQPGRRNPVPGLPTWGKVKSAYFPFSDSHMRRLLAEPKPERAEGHARPEETGTSEEPEPSEIDVEVEEAGTAQETPTPTVPSEAQRRTEPAPSDAEAEQPETKPEAQGTPETGKPGRRERPSWRTVADDFRKVFKAPTQREERIRMFFEKVGSEFYKDIREAANSLVTPMKDTSASRSAAAKNAKETRSAKAGRDREDRKQEILAILSADPSHAFTLAGVRQRMGNNTLSDLGLRDILNEGVRQERWDRHRSGTENLNGWCMPGAYSKWHDGQFGEGRTYDHANDFFLGNDKEEAAWAEKKAREHEEWAELDKQLRAEHPEYRQPGETDEEWAARKEEVEKKVREEKKKARSEASRKAAMTRKVQHIPIQLEDGRTGHIVKGGGRKSRSPEYTVRTSDGTVVKVPKSDYGSAINMKCDAACEVPQAWLDDEFDLPADRVNDFLRPYMENSN